MHFICKKIIDLSQPQSWNLNYYNFFLYRWAARDQDKKAQEGRKRDMLVLVHKHLFEEGLTDAATILGNIGNYDDQAERHYLKSRLIMVILFPFSLPT